MADAQKKSLKERQDTRQRMQSDSCLQTAEQIGKYSSDPNKCAGPNKRAGWNFDKD